MRIGKIAVLVLAALAAPAMAADPNGFYAGFDVGQSNFDISRSDVNNIFDGAFSLAGDTLPGFSYTNLSTGLDDKQTTYSLFVGYQFMPYIATELTWMDLGEAKAKGNADFTYAPNPPAILPGSIKSGVKFSSSGPALSVLGILPFGDAWSVYGRLGVYYSDTKLRADANTYDITGASIGSASGEQSKNTSEFLWGLGAAYTWNHRVSFRLEYDGIPNVGDKNHTGEINVGRITLGALYRFGNVEETAVPIAAAAPVAAVAAAPTKCKDSDNDGVCDSVDKCPNTPAGDRVGPYGCSCDVTVRTHFAFDSAELTAEDKATLDKVAARLQELHFVEGVANGHTDSVGDAAYNQKLSERRAQAVVDYLAAKGVAPGRIKAVGYGETKPIADNATEEGRAQNRRVTLHRTDCGPSY